MIASSCADSLIFFTCVVAGLAVFFGIESAAEPYRASTEEKPDGRS